MQHNAPQQQTKSTLPRKDFAPKKRRNLALSTLPYLLLFVALLVVLYLIFPKEAGKNINKSQYDGLVISEVMSANSTAVPDENGNFYDWLEIYNGTGADLDMAGVMLTNRTDKITFPFPSYILKAGERVIVYASNSYQLETDKPFHGKFKISSVGAHLYMYDPEMYLIDDVAVPTMTADSSYILASIDEDGAKHYETTDYYSPGFDNTEQGFIDYRASNATQSGALAINEICPDPKVGIPDEDGEIVDWVEIKNNTDQTMSLSGFYLSDKENKPLKWRFPEGAAIPAHGYYLVFCSGKDKLQQNGIPHTSFSVSAERETIVLSDSGGRLVDRKSVENVPEDYSMGMTDTGEWRQFDLATPGASNDADGQAQTDARIRQFNPTGVYISEVMASNDVTAIGTTATATDYVELYNSTNQYVDLSLYGLSDSLKRPRRWQFPQGAAIAPGEYKIIFLDGDTSLTTTSEYHTNFRLIRAGGETISFCDPTGKVLDRMPLKLIPTDHSYGRTLGYAGFYYYDVPTPGTANGTGYYGYTATPSFTMPGGEYKGSIQVSIDVPENSVVYYTQDGSVPTVENGAQYDPSQPFEISRVTVLRARAFDPSGMLQPSEIVTQTYLPNLYHAFPIVSLVADPYALWNAETGMLTVGPDVDKSRGIPFRNTIYRMVKEELDLKTPCHVELYDKEGVTVVDQDAEFSLQGDYSLDMPQKTFKIKAKAKYGAKFFDAKLFEDREYTQYKGFVVRTSGNDNAWTRINDGYQGHMIDRFNELTDTPSTVIHQAWKPVVVYLNGIYWGHYNLRERIDRYFVAQHEGLPMDEADNMTILQGSSSVNWGSNREYRAMIEKIRTLNTNTSEEDLQYITDRVDVDNCFDYYAFEMFFGNSDAGNIRFYKLDQEGAKWKWIFYDTDYGLFNSGYYSTYSWLKEQGAGDKRINNVIIRKLLENDEMRHKFLTRLGEMFQVFTTDFMIQEWNAMAEMIEPEMPLHFTRWAEETDKAITFDNPNTPEGALRYWNERIERTRNVLKKRPTYFYEMVQEWFELTNEQMVIYFGQKPVMPSDAIVNEGKWG